MIVITGGTGTVGSRLVGRLAERGQRVRVFSRDPDAARAMSGAEVEVAAGDFDDPGSLDAALAGADRLFLLTGGSLDPDAQPRHERAVIQAARRAGTGRVVKLSVLGADEQAPIRYLQTHRATERALAASGLDHTILRPAGFMQNLLDWAAGGAIHSCAKDGRTAMVDARDIADVAAAVLTEDGHQGRTYTLTGPSALSFDEVAATLSAATGRTIRHVRVSPEALVEAMIGHGVPPWLAQDIAAQFQGYAAAEDGPVSEDVAAVLGRPARSLETFAREEFAVRDGAAR